MFTIFEYSGDDKKKPSSVWRKALKLYFFVSGYPPGVGIMVQIQQPMIMVVIIKKGAVQAVFRVMDNKMVCKSLGSFFIFQIFCEKYFLPNKIL